MLCEKHGTPIQHYEVICTLNGEYCTCLSADEETGEAWVFATEDDLKAITAFDLLYSGDYDLRKTIGVSFFECDVRKRVRGEVKLHIACIECASEQKVAA